MPSQCVAEVLCGLVDRVKVSYCISVKFRESKIWCTCVKQRCRITEDVKWGKHVALWSWDIIVKRNDSMCRKTILRGILKLDILSKTNSVTVLNQGSLAKWTLSGLRISNAGVKPNGADYPCCLLILVYHNSQESSEHMIKIIIRCSYK